MKKKVYIETLGCAKNRVDSEIMMGALIKEGFTLTTNSENAEVIAINTCGFIEKAVIESIDRILSLAMNKSEGLCEKLIVAGCLSERYREKLMVEIPEIDAVLGTSDYSKLPEVIRKVSIKNERKGFLSDRPLYSKNNHDIERIISTPYYAYVKIAEGCSNMCSFCNIPLLRGRFKSRGLDEVISEIKRLIDKNIKEINLISQDTSSYGIDFGERNGLKKLISGILKKEKRDFWLRIFYSYPNNYPLELFKLMEDDERLAPYVDMPFQHYSDAVLKAMNRKITSRDIDRIIDAALIAKTDIAFRTTLMVGFPNETKDDFKKLVEMLQKQYFQHVGVFKYSSEDNIKSAKMGDPIPEEIKEERRKELMVTQQQISYKKNQAHIGQIQNVLIEGTYEETELLLKGRNIRQGPEIDGLVLINSGIAQEGQFNKVKITEAHPYDLIGEIV